MPASRIEQRLRREAALDTTYSKGRQLVAGGYVLSCDATPSPIAGTVVVGGTIQGSHGAAYRTRVTLDLDDEDIVSYGCDCPAATSYDGMCKHEIALALYYLNSAGESAPSERPVGTTDAARRPHSPSKDPRATAYPAPTSPQIASALGALNARRAGEAAAVHQARAHRTANAPELPVELLATLTPSNDTYYQAHPTWCLKLRVRRGKVSYVVKNMADLVRAWKTGAELTYGRNLSFVHTPAAFDARSRTLLGIVARIVDSQQALFASRYQYWGAGRGTDIKELPLSDADVIAVLDALRGSEVAVDCSTVTGGRYGTGAPDVRTLLVTTGDPRIAASLRPSTRGGYDLDLPVHLRCFWDAGTAGDPGANGPADTGALPAGGPRLYLLDSSTAWCCSPQFSSQAGPLLGSLLPAGGPLHIGDPDLGAFCLAALPALRACTELEVPAELEDLRPPEAAFTFKIGCDDGLVDCLPTVSYGNWTADIYEPQHPGQPARDLAAEYRAQDAVEAYFPGGDPTHPHFDEDDDERLYLLLTEGLHELGDLGEVLLSERLRGLKVHDAPQLRVKATVRSGLLDVAVDASGLAPRDLATYLASYKRKQRFVRLSDGDIVKLDDNARALNDLADGLGIDVETLTENGGATGLPSNRTLFVDALLKRTERVRLERNQAFRAMVRDFETFGDADFEVPATLRDVLRPYQVAGFRWLQTLERLGFGGILADDMGLGKTVQTIAHILARKEAGDPGATLIVCPASLVYNWAAELEKFAPQLACACVLGNKAQRETTIARAAGSPAVGTGRNPRGAADHQPLDVLVTSYDLMKRDVDAYARQHFSRVVLDEAHYIKNAGTQAAKCAKCLPSDVRFALTGTPVENRLAELWSIFDFLMPGILGSRDAFAKRFEGPVEHGEQGASRRLQCLVAPFILRRLKTDVLADLPEKNESVVLARMDGEQDRLYKATQDLLARQIAHELPDEFKRNKLQVLAELTKLRQICCDPRLCFENYTGGSAKLDTCMELVRSGLDAGHRILLFSQFTSMLELIGERLEAEKVAYLTLTGATSKEERARLVERFQAGGSNGGSDDRDRADVFLISLKAGGVGLNLTAADMVIHYDPWWNLAAQNQATDRAHRIGQARAVSVFQLIAQGTVEERIVKMQQRKRDLAESVLGGDGVASTALTREDVLALLDARE